MLTRNEIYEMYKTHCLYNNRPSPFEETEGQFLSNLKSDLEENPIALNRYFHYTGFVSGVEAMFAKVGGSVENSEISERLIDYYVGNTEH